MVSRLLFIGKNTSLCHLLLRQGYSLVPVPSWREAEPLLKTGAAPISLILLEAEGTAALSVFLKLRELTETPVIILAPDGQRSPEAACLLAGAEDYLSGCEPEVVQARVQVALRRHHSSLDEISFHGFSIDSRRHSALLDGRPMALTPKEFDLLYYFAQNHSQVLTRGQILDHLWDGEANDRLIDTYIRNLRRKLGPHGRSLVTLRGVGYRFLWDTVPDTPPV